MCFEVKNIMYLMNFIQDVYNGQLIIKKIIDVYFFKCCIYEFNVVEYDCKFYVLENKKFWVLKNVDVVMGLLIVIGNVKISMDYIMFYSFIFDNIRDVDIKMDLIRYIMEERFMLEYI